MLLKQVTDVPFEIIVPEVDESISPSWSPRRAVCSLSEAKALAVAVKEDDVVIAADTLVFLRGRLLGKPATPQEAVSMLERLSGRRHKVYTGVTVRRGEETATACAVAVVTFRRLNRPEIDRYVQSGEPLDKAGAYGISGRGALFVTSVRGDYYTVVGLPLSLTAQMLKQFEVAL